MCVLTERLLQRVQCGSDLRSNPEARNNTVPANFHYVVFKSQKNTERPRLFNDKIPVAQRRSTYSGDNIMKEFREDLLRRGYDKDIINTQIECIVVFHLDQPQTENRTDIDDYTQTLDQIAQTAGWFDGFFYHPGIPYPDTASKGA